MMALWPPEEQSQTLQPPVLDSEHLSNINTYSLQRENKEEKNVNI